MRGIKANGAGIMVQAGKFADVERGLARSREAWMGRGMLDLFRGGRTAPLFARLELQQDDDDWAKARM